ncbi:MAG: hypothetical protein Q8P90_02295 [bacterium]|nr:hypothetical protein [bacterium]
MLIALTGEKLSGKGTASDYFANEKDAKKFRFSQVLFDILERLHKDTSRKNLVDLGIALRKVYGDDVLAQVLVEDIKKDNSKIQIVDGMRYLAEYELLKKLPNFKLVYVSVPMEVRFKRMKDRSEKADESAMTFDEFKQRETDKTEIEILELAKLADYTITNRGSLEDYYNQLQAITE